MGAVNIYEAKTQLSRLLRRVRAGEEIVIADHGTPVAKLVPIDPPSGARVLGADRGRVWIASDAFDPMSEAELTVWNDAPVVPPSRGRTKTMPAKPTKKKRPARKGHGE